MTAEGLTGIPGARRVLKIYENREKDTWTIVLVAPDGSACMMAAGTQLRFRDHNAVGQTL